MRVAASRVAALDAVSATREHAGRCVRALPVSLSVLKRIGVACGAAASVMGGCAGLRSRKNSAQKAVKDSSSAASGVLQIVLQLVGPMLLPVLQRYLAKRASGAQGKTVGF